MSAGLQVVQALRVCGGTGLVIARSAHASGPLPSPAVGLALASLLGEREARGDRARTVVLRLAHRDDAIWAAPALAWLAEHGRRPLLRTAVVLPRPLVTEAATHGATVLLELADARAPVDRALLGPGADPAAALLLHAQHLRALDIEVAAHLGPLMPTMHDRPEVIAPLVGHIVAADIRDAHLVVGRLTGARLDALAAALGWPAAAGIARAFDVVAEPDGSLPIPALGARLPHRPHVLLYHEVRRLAESRSLRVDHCGCPAQCHLDPHRTPAYRPLLTPDLFDHAS